MTRDEILRKIRTGQPMFVTRGGRQIVPVRLAKPNQPGFVTRRHDWGEA
jgi:hypothetical protein